MAEQTQAKKSSLAVRFLTIVALLLVIVAALQYIRLKTELSNGVKLYNEDKYQEAIDALTPLRGKMLASLGLRSEAERVIGLSMAQLAIELALKERSAEGYEKAIAMLEEAQRLAGPSKNIQDRLDEYRGYLSRQRENDKKRPEQEAPAPLPDGAAQ